MHEGEGDTKLKEFSDKMTTQIMESLERSTSEAAKKNVESSPIAKAIEM